MKEVGIRRTSMFERDTTNEIYYHLGGVGNRSNQCSDSNKHIRVIGGGYKIDKVDGRSDKDLSMEVVL